MNNLNMKDIILLNEKQGLISGENSIIKTHSNFLPTVIEDLIISKIQRDKEDIEKALKLLEFYISKGLKDYNKDIEKLYQMMLK